MSQTTFEGMIAHYTQLFLQLTIEKQDLERPSLCTKIFTSPDAMKRRILTINRKLLHLQKHILWLKCNSNAEYRKVRPFILNYPPILPN